MAGGDYGHTEVKLSHNKRIKRNNIFKGMARFQSYGILFIFVHAQKKCNRTSRKKSLSFCCIFLNKQRGYFPLKIKLR